MKILHILATSVFSGAENVVCQIIGMLRGTGHEMVYCSPDGPIRERLKELDISFYPLKELSTDQLRKAIVSIRPDIIHAHDMRASYVSSLVCDKIPIVSHIHNNAYDSRRLSLKSLGFLLASRKIKHIFWVSKSAFKDYYFRKAVSKKSSVLPNILDLEKLHERVQCAKENTECDVIFLGRLAYPKNPIGFVELIKLVAEKIPTVKAVMVGDGSQKDETLGKIKEYDLSSNITLLGFISNPLKILQNAKVLVLTSFWEGTPMCSLEALGLGIPVASTPIDGLKDIIVNDKNGMLSDSIPALSEFVVKILKDTTYSDYLSSQAKYTATVINDKENYTESLLKVYLQVLTK